MGMLWVGERGSVGVSREEGEDDRGRNAHRDEVDKRPSLLRVVDQARLTLLARLDVLTHVPLRYFASSSVFRLEGGEKGEEERTAAFPSVYLRGCPWTVPPPGVWRKRPVNVRTSVREEGKM
jgi:hypothetical protein